MRKFIISLTTIASLSLAAVPILGLASAAQAAEPVARIKVGDLNLRDPAQAAQFHARVKTEGAELCRQMAEAGSGLSRNGCLIQVRALAQAELSAAQRRDLGLAGQARAMQVAGR